MIPQTPPNGKYLYGALELDIPTGIPNFNVLSQLEIKRGFQI